MKNFIKVGTRHGVPVWFEQRQGKGSHGRLYYGDKFTTLKDRKKEIGSGLLNAMFKQLGIDKNNI